MIGDQHADIALRQVPDDSLNVEDRDGVHTGERFVEQHELGLDGQRAPHQIHEGFGATNKKFRFREYSCRCRDFRERNSCVARCEAKLNTDVFIGDDLLYKIAAAGLIEKDPTTKITVDLNQQKVSYQNSSASTNEKNEIAFDIDSYTKWRLLEGLDDIGLTLRHESKITEFEKTRPAFKPVTQQLTQVTPVTQNKELFTFEIKFLLFGKDFLACRAKSPYFIA